MWKTIRPEERFFRVSVDNCFGKIECYTPRKVLPGRFRKVHCFNCKYPSDTDQKFTDEGKHPAKTRYTLEKFPKKHGNYKTDDVFTYTPGTIKYDAKINKTT